MGLAIVEAFQTLYCDFVVFFTTFVSYLSSWVGFVTLLIILLLFCRFRYALTFAITSGVVSGIVNLIKIIMKKDRPFVAGENVMNLLQANGYSMPSGHVANAVVLMVFISYIIYKKIKNKPLKICLFCMCGIFIISVIFSRIFLGQHYLIDTIVGLIIGGVVSVGALFVYEKKIKDYNFAKNKNK